MEIPEKLKIGGHLFDIDQSEELDDINGDTDFRKNRIRIDSGLTQSQKESTLIHEIFHVLNCTLDDKDYGHALLDSLSEQFYQVLRDNNLIK